MDVQDKSEWYHIIESARKDIQNVKDHIILLCILIFKCIKDRSDQVTDIEDNKHHHQSHHLTLKLIFDFAAVTAFICQAYDSLRQPTCMLPLLCQQDQQEDRCYR